MMSRLVPCLVCSHLPILTLSIRVLGAVYPEHSEELRNEIWAAKCRGYSQGVGCRKRQKIDWQEINFNHSLVLE